MQIVGLGPTAPAVPVIPAVESTRRLLGASFDLVGRASDDMRRASFYIGVIVVLTVAPAALGSWAIEVASFHRNGRRSGETFSVKCGTAWYGLLFYLALAGLIVAAVESRTMASSLLGGHFAQRPITVRQALARSRMVFWRAIVASIIVAIPVGVAQSRPDDPGRGVVRSARGPVRPDVAGRGAVRRTVRLPSDRHRPRGRDRAGGDEAIVSGVSGAHDRSLPRRDLRDHRPGPGHPRAVGRARCRAAAVRRPWGRCRIRSWPASP